ncbi:hypothetical protein CC78DRAFT_144443 [Lojkania enalia]|uniref:Uncharacterized protein n=1 Tax=Lojkania enalia TaxID=147567 RepID=A0A9P4JZW7_9PLEO|nr:hypothetical protein CC78DRAFT_144443 [Didymosphaeria enalia]
MLTKIPLSALTTQPTVCMCLPLTIIRTPTAQHASTSSFPFLPIPTQPSYTDQHAHNQTPGYSIRCENDDMLSSDNEGARRTTSPA